MNLIPNFQPQEPPRYEFLGRTDETTHVKVNFISFSRNMIDDCGQYTIRTYTSYT